MTADNTATAEAGAPATGTTAPSAETNTPATEVKVNDAAAAAKALQKANKEAEMLRLKLKEFEDRDKNEQQLLAERVAAAEKVAADREAELRRYRVGTAKGLPADLIERLRGDSDDDLAADADKLLSLLPAPAAAPRATGASDQGARSDLSSAALNGDPLLESVKSKLGIV